MLYGAYLSASGVAQAKASQDVIANNLANAETVGFKRLMTLHAHRPLTEPGAVPGSLSAMTGGNILLPTHLDSQQGGLEQTGNPLDLALLGDGYLAIGDADAPGQTWLTRDGRLGIDDAGYLTLATDPNSRVLGADNLPIRVPPETIHSTLRVRDDGVIYNELTNDEVARLRLAMPQNPDTLVPVGGGRFQVGGPLFDATGQVTVTAGYVERSNVDPTVELTRMIEAGRLLETNANMIRYADTSLGKLIEASRVG